MTDETYGERKDERKKQDRPASSPEKTIRDASQKPAGGPGEGIQGEARPDYDSEQLPGRGAGMGEDDVEAGEADDAESTDVLGKNRRSLEDSAED